MASRSPSRGRSMTRSGTPYSARSRSPRRSISPRSASRSRTPEPRIDRRNGRGRRSPTRSVSHSPVRDGSRGRGGRGYRSRSYARSPSPAPKSSKIVVEKLTKNVNEDHLREIFGAYGPIRELDLPMNRQFMTNRGTAYILYTEAGDAEAAIAHMHEAQLDGAIINVSIVLPRRKFSRSPPPARRAPPPDQFDRGPPGGAYRGPPPRPIGGGRYRSPLRRSPPPRRFGRPDPRGSNTYRPRSYSRSRSPRGRSRSYSSRSPSRTPPPRRRQPPRGESPPRGGGRRRSPSYSSYSSYSGRSRSRSRGRYGRGRR